MGRGRVGRPAPLVGLGLAAAAIRFATLGQQSFWFDEAATGRLMRMGLGAMLRALPDGESTPPLYYVVAWLWTRAFGTGEVGLRSLSALCGTLAVPVVYAAAARWSGRAAGLAAAALTGFSPLLIWYSQEARAYALLVLLCAASVWALAAAATPGAPRRALAVWAAICALALATHYFAAFVIAGEVVWLVHARGARSSWPALAGVGLVGLALAPLALHQRAQNNAGFIAASPLATRLAQAAKQLVVGYDAPGQVALSVAAGLILAGLIWVAFTGGRGGSGRAAALRLGAVAAGALVLPVGLALAGLDYVITRNLIGAWVPAAVALAAGAVGARGGGRAGPALVAGLCAVGLAATVGIDLDGRYQRDDWRAAARTVPVGSGAAAVLVTPASGHGPLGYYLRSSRPMVAAGAAVRWVEVIGLAPRGVGAPLRPPAIPPGQPGIAGFAGPFAERHATFVALRYRALAAPVAVTPQMLSSLALGRGRPATLLVGG